MAQTIRPKNLKPRTMLVRNDPPAPPDYLGKLDQKVWRAVTLISEMVGSTLGPGGRTVSIERAEFGQPPFVTKDGVTVLRAMGFRDQVLSQILETFRDVAIRTANEAGDGTTTATVIAAELTTRTIHFCRENRNVSPQLIVRRANTVLLPKLLDVLKRAAVRVDPETPAGVEVLRGVARVSGNGDGPLADAVVTAIERVGDYGNVVILEEAGTPGYQTVSVEGYPLQSGYEESCRNFFPIFLGPDPSICLDRPGFILVNGQIRQPGQLIMAAQKIWGEIQKRQDAAVAGADYDGPALSSHVVVVATGFSEHVLSWLARQWGSDSLKILPVVLQKTGVLNFEIQQLGDLAAVTGAKVFDVVNNPLDNFQIEDLGPGVSHFECHRWRSTVLGYARSPGTRTNDPYDRIRMERVNQLQKQVAQAASELDRKFVQDRLAKLVGGVCQIIVRGVSNADIRERRDRVEDAVCSVRAAIRSGVLPGAGWGLLCCIRELHEQWSKDTDSLDNKIAKDILVPALAEPVRRLLRNASCPEVTYTMMLDEVEARRPVVHNAILDEAVYDVVDGRWVQPQEAGLLDALPAVTEALINSFSIALTLGQLGGLITSDFDREVELNEVRDNQEFERYANTNEANERI